MPTFCTWKIYTAPTRRWEEGWGRNEREENKEIFEMKAFRVWTDGMQRGRFLLTRAVGGMWHSSTPQQEQRWLTQGDEFTGDLLLTRVHGHFPRVPLGWHSRSHRCRAAARDRQMDQQFPPTCTPLNQSHQSQSQQTIQYWVLTNL